ncbi:MAG: hypothetical protein EXR99_13920 [Gemmataceae bacterium]|nr:hypothetical protein [Gemmataceae bacterium]
MKKLFMAAMLAAMGVGTSQAGPNFGILPCHIFNWGGCKNDGTFVIRPYNAFSPVCSGTIYCDGFMPISSGNPQGGCSYLNYSDGAPHQAPPVPQPSKKGAWIYPQGQFNNYPVFMQPYQQMPYQQMPYQQLPYQQLPFQVIPLQTVPVTE